MRLRHRLRQRRQPALGLPLARVFAPDLLVPVRVHNGDHNHRASGEEDVGELPAVLAYDGLAEGEDDVLARPGRDVSSGSK